MKRGKNTHLGQALDGLVGRLDRKSGGALTQLRVMNAWSAVAGASVLAHTTGAHLRGSEILVYVDSSVWATELSALAGHYLTAMKAEMGEVSVSGLRFAVSKKVSESRAIAAEEPKEAEEAAPADETAREPLSEIERAQVEASAAGIADDDLREAVIRATVADLEWKKGRAAAKGRQKPREGA